MTNLLPQVQDITSVLFLAAFVVNFAFWIAKSQSRDLLFVPQNTWGRAAVYLFGLFGPVIYFAGKFFPLEELTMVGLCMTNGCLVFMNLAALMRRRRAT